MPSLGTHPPAVETEGSGVAIILLVDRPCREVTIMDEDTVFTKRFIDCIKKAPPERNEQVRYWARGV